MEMREVVEQYEDRLMRLPHVRGIGIGEKAGKLVIKVLVSKKVPESYLKTQEIIPKMLEGYETDVEEVGEVTARG